MNLQTYFQARALGVELLAEAAALSKSDMVSMGAAPDDADFLLTLTAVYYGKTPFSRKQARAVAGARRQRHGLSTLGQIEKYVSRVRGQRQAWDLRVELCQTPGNRIDFVARKRLREILTPPQPAPKVRTPVTPMDSGPSASPTLR
ncbi:hypothetical protein AZH46_10770 [Corynebacterium striatum]|nr:hypothetical protein AZH46_10770 [Corynebacterium striatum]